MQPQEKFTNLLASFAFSPNASSSSTLQPLTTVGKKRKQDQEEGSGSPSKRVKQDVTELPPLQDRLEKNLDGKRLSAAVLAMTTSSVIICGCKYG